MRLTKGNVTIGIHTRFGPNWPGIRCLAKTRRGTKCQRAIIAVTATGKHQSAYKQQRGFIKHSHD